MMIDKRFSGRRKEFLTHSDTLDDLEYSRAANHEKEETHQPRSHWILLITLTSRFWNVAPHRYHLLGLLIGDLHSLLGNHFDGDGLEFAVKSVKTLEIGGGPDAGGHGCDASEVKRLTTEM